MYESILASDAQNRSYKRLYDKTKTLAVSLFKGEEEYIGFENKVNLRMDDIMNSFRKDYPNLKEPDYRLICFFFAGFDATTIHIISGLPSVAAVYMRKTRLKQMINESGASNKEKYLACLR